MQPLPAAHGFSRKGEASSPALPQSRALVKPSRTPESPPLWDGPILGLSFHIYKHGGCAGCVQLYQAGFKLSPDSSSNLRELMKRLPLPNAHVTALPWQTSTVAKGQESLGEVVEPRVGLGGLAFPTQAQDLTSFLQTS